MDTNDIRDDEQFAQMLQRAGARPAVDAQLKDRVRSAVHEAWHEETASRSRRRTFGWTAAIAATVAAALLVRPTAAPPVPTAVVARVELVRGTASVRPAQEIVTGSVVSTGTDSLIAMQWKEHGSLRLAPESRVRFISDDAVELQHGAIYFASAPGAGAPVAVHTKFGSVTDIGTGFEVRVESDALRVRVREGLVELDRDGTKQRVGAGSEITAGPGGVKLAAISPTSPDWNWVLAAAPPMILDGNARVVLTAIAREKGMTLVFIDRALADRVAQMSLHDRVPLTPDEALDAATTAADLSYRVKGNSLVIGWRLAQ